jgi:hypothetical protein
MSEKQAVLPDLNFKPRPMQVEDNLRRRIECREHQLLTLLQNNGRGDTAAERSIDL